MYQVFISHHPAAGKAAQLRAAMEERSKAAIAAGTPLALATQIWGPEPNFVHIRRHANLTELEAYGEKAQADATYRTAIAKITECLDRPQVPELHEILVAAQPSGPVNYAMRVRFTPLAGKGPELRQLLQKRASVPSKGVVGAGLSAQVVPSGGANFNAMILFSDMAGFEAYRANNQADPAFASFQAQLAPLISAPASQAMYRILVPFPA